MLILNLRMFGIANQQIVDLNTSYVDIKHPVKIELQLAIRFKYILC